MQNKYLKFLLIILVIAFIVPQITLAAWYNPFSWHVWGDFWNYFFHKQTPTTQQITACTKEAKVCPDGSTVGRTGPNCEFAPCPVPKGVLIDSLKNLTLSYPNPYDVSKTDTFTLVNGKSDIIYDTGNIKPRIYNEATTTVGDLDGDGISEGVVGIYQGWGANRITPIVFVFSNKNGPLTQIDSAVPDTSNWQDETQIKSLSIDNGILSVNLIVLATKDQNLPHYQQQASVPKTVQYKLINGKLVEQQANQTAGWQTYKDNYGFQIDYPTDINVMATPTSRTVSCDVSTFPSSCPKGISPGYPDKSEKKIINGINYCFYTGDDCGAGSCTIYYSYLTAGNNICYILDFSKRRLNDCPIGSRCGSDQDVEDSLINQAVSTIKFIK